MKNSVFIFILGFLVPIFTTNATVLPHPLPSEPSVRVSKSVQQTNAQPTQNDNIEDSQKAKKALNAMLIGLGVLLVAVLSSVLKIEMLVVALGVIGLSFLFHSLVLTKNNSHKKAKIARIVIWSILGITALMVAALYIYGIGL